MTGPPGRVTPESAQTLLCGPSETVLPTLPRKWFHTCITSPPYFRLRKYLKGDSPLVDAEIGTEKTPEEYIEKLVALFRQVREVLRDDGTCWIVIGDSYVSGKVRTDWKGGRGWKNTQSEARSNLAEGNLLLIPFRLALALQADGWIVRCDVIWHKPNGMSESVDGWRWERCKKKVSSSTRGAEGSYHAEAYGEKPQGGREGREFASAAEWEDCPGCRKCETNDGLVLRTGKGRPTKTHEYVLMLAKSESYYFDSFAVREASSESSQKRVAQKTFGSQTGGPKDYSYGTNPNRSARKSLENFARSPGFRNRRSVWTVTTVPLSGAKLGVAVEHFAAFPPALVTPCILAGSPEGGCCADCGAPFVRIIEKGKPDREHQRACGGNADGEYHGLSQKDYGGGKAQVASATKARILAGMREKKSVGWKASCSCGAESAEARLPVPARVLDPFMGAGTTLRVARHYGREGTGIELNPDYLPLAEAHIALPLKEPKAIKGGEAYRNSSGSPSPPLQLSLLEDAA